ncbi:MAG TPA: hypothetical protein VG842_07010 [Sediminibacterium sp.]|nr:hypothetical protein [Sediminibacterium sp.]
MLYRLGLVMIIAGTATSLAAQSGREEKETTLQEIYDASGNRIQFSGTKLVGGSPYYNEDWLTGNVYFMSGKKMENASLRYNLNTQQVECKLQDLEFPLINPIREFTLRNTDKGVIITDLFRTGYPPNIDEPKAKYYKVLWEKPGVGQLLEYQYAIIENANASDPGSDKVYRIKSKLYAWPDASKRWVPLRKGQDIMDAFPEKADKIKAAEPDLSDKPLLKDAVLQLLNTVFL